MLAVGLFFLLGAHPVFWAMPAALLSGPAAAAGIALVNSIGNLGGFVGPYLVGVMKDATGSTDGGLITLAVILAFGAFLATRVAHDPALEREPRRGGRFSRTKAPRRRRSRSDDRRATSSSSAAAPSAASPPRTSRERCAAWSCSTPTRRTSSACATPA